MARVVYIVVLLSTLALSGCSNVDHNLSVNLWKDIERRKAVNSDIQNNLQILIYAGLTRKNDTELSDCALTTCLNIVGWPDELEKEYVSHLCKSDVESMSCNIQNLLDERSKLNASIYRDQKKMTKAYSQYGASHESLNTLKWFIGSITVLLGLAALIIFLVRKF